MAEGTRKNADTWINYQFKKAISYSHKNQSTTRYQKTVRYHLPNSLLLDTYQTGDGGGRDRILSTLCVSYWFTFQIYHPKSGSWGLPEMRDGLYGSGYEDFFSFPNRSPCG